ncbi:MAG: YlxP-like protein [uncultured Nocardioidaceae bacterium]|uniref:YlxP-like protein n=1 Tax=uncultured Nocardioidaceae bacterium TaxID=253824 RepID=A0A6J4MFU9_9ACTN|nr:MAG: YlxP-like protein [uncultured Nocardioidaceae bacterium]
MAGCAGAAPDGAGTAGTVRWMWIGWLELDLLLGDVHSLKAKRSVVRPVIAELRRRFEVSAAEVGDQDLHRRARIGVAVVADGAAHIGAVLDRVERTVSARPELDLLSARRELRRSDD